MLIVGKCLLSDLRKKRHLTQQELADILQIHKSRISEYENGKHIMNVETLKNVSVVLKCDMEDVYEWIQVADE